jgi:hypothetical protein
MSSGGSARLSRPAPDRRPRAGFRLIGYRETFAPQAEGGLVLRNGLPDPAFRRDLRFAGDGHPFNA